MVVVEERVGMERVGRVVKEEREAGEGEVIYTSMMRDIRRILAGSQIQRISLGAWRLMEQGTSLTAMEVTKGRGATGWLRGMACEYLNRFIRTILLMVI